MTRFRLNSFEYGKIDKSSYRLIYTLMISTYFTARNLHSLIYETMFYNEAIFRPLAFMFK